MNDILDGGEPVEQRQPNEARVTRFAHHRRNEVIHSYFVFDWKQLILQPLLVAERRRLVDGRRKRQDFPHEIDRLPVNQLTGAVGNLREDVCGGENVFVVDDSCDN